MRRLICQRLIGRDRSTRPAPDTQAGQGKARDRDDGARDGPERHLHGGTPDSCRRPGWAPPGSPVAVGTRQGVVCRQSICFTAPAVHSRCHPWSLTARMFALSQGLPGRPSLSRPRWAAGLIAGQSSSEAWWSAQDRGGGTSQQPLARTPQRPAEHVAGSGQAVDAVVAGNDPGCQPCFDAAAQGPGFPRDGGDLREIVTVSLCVVASTAADSPSCGATSITTQRAKFRQDHLTRAALRQSFLGANPYKTTKGLQWVRVARKDRRT